MDGTLSDRLIGLDPSATYFVAVSGYTGDGLESALSNELALGTPDLCTEDVYTTPTQCRVQPLPDGTPCRPGAVPAARPVPSAPARNRRTAS